MDRWEAKEKKLPTFDSLYPCPVCGSSKRYTVKMNCVECHLARIGSKSSPRNIAKAAKLVTYQTGKPCKKGHVAMRYTSTGQCVECVNPKSASSPPTGHSKTRGLRYRPPDGPPSPYQQSIGKKEPGTQGREYRAMSGDSATSLKPDPSPSDVIPDNA
jgi:hypothetical protein